MVELRHAPEWELLLPGQAAGDALRAIAWAGKTRARETISALRHRLKPAEQRNLLSLTLEERREVFEPPSTATSPAGLALGRGDQGYVERLQRVDEAGQSGDLDDR